MNTMKTTITAVAIALIGSAAVAEIDLSGNAHMGVSYDSMPGDMMSKYSFDHEVGLDISMSGTSDGGLAFGAEMELTSGDETLDKGSVWVSGAFGKLSVGEVDAADKLAGGIADVGFGSGLGVDDVAHVLRGNTASQVRYEHQLGGVKFAVSAGNAKSGEWGNLTLIKPTSEANAEINFKNLNERIIVNSGSAVLKNSEFLMPGFKRLFITYDLTPEGVTGTAEGRDRIILYSDYNPRGGQEKTEYALGVSADVMGAEVGIGYGSDKVISLGAGYNANAVSANVFYSQGKDSFGNLMWKYKQAGSPPEGPGGADARKAANLALLKPTDKADDSTANGMFATAAKSYGVDIAYSFGDSKVSLTYAKLESDITFTATGNKFNDVGYTPTFSRTVSQAVDSYGLGFEQDLGGGVVLVAGVAQVPNSGGNVSQLAACSGGDYECVGISPATKNVASVGVSMQF